MSRCLLRPSDSREFGASGGGGAKKMHRSFGFAQGGLFVGSRSLRARFRFLRMTSQSGQDGGSIRPTAKELFFCGL